MADSFADLWNSSAPSKPTQQPTVGSLNANNNGSAKRPQQDAFDLLSSTKSSGSSSRPYTPSTSGTSSQQRTTPNPTQSQKPGDAFSSLLGGSFSGGANGRGSHMTIAERAKEVERQKLDSLRKQNVAFNKQTHTPSAWDGLDTLAKSPSKPAPGMDDDDWGFGPIASQPPTTSPSPALPPSADDDWLWMSTAPAPKTTPPRSSQARRPDTPQKDFDFGNREDTLLDNDSNDEDDILGALSKPITSDSKGKHVRPSILSRYIYFIHLITPEVPHQLKPIVKSKLFSTTSSFFEVKWFSFLKVHLASPAHPRSNR